MKRGSIRLAQSINANPAMIDHDSIVAAEVMHNFYFRPYSERALSPSKEEGAEAMWSRCLTGTAMARVIASCARDTVTVASSAGRDSLVAKLLRSAVLSLAKAAVNHETDRDWWLTWLDAASARVATKDDWRQYNERVAGLHSSQAKGVIYDCARVLQGLVYDNGRIQHANEDVISDMFESWLHYDDSSSGFLEAWPQDDVCARKSNVDTKRADDLLQERRRLWAERDQQIADIITASCPWHAMRDAFAESASLESWPMWSVVSDRVKAGRTIAVSGSESAR